MKKFISIITSLSLLLNSFSAPLIVLAQEVTPTPEPTPIVVEETASPTPTIEATTSPTENSSPTPTDEATPSSEPTISPSETPTDVPTQEPQLETQSPTNENSETLAPPTETSTTTPEPIIEIPEAEGIITTEIVENQNPFPVTVQNNSWFSLTTDKLDYAPTETAIISGSDFTPNKTYEITVSSNDDPATSRTQNIVTDLDGKFVFYYQLDGIYRPNYRVEVKDDGFVVATTTFTDSDPEIVSTLAQLNAALADTSITTINITADITGITSSVVVGRTVTINGGGFTLGFTGLEAASGGVDDGLLIQAPATINNLIVNAGLAVPTTWAGTYAIHIYNTSATLNGVTATNGNGGILVNGSAVTLTGITTVSGNGFGGIEVSASIPNGLPDSILTVTGTLVNSTEAYGKPTIWLIDEQGTVTGANVPATTSTTIVVGQTQYYLSAGNAVDPTTLVWPTSWTTPSSCSIDISDESPSSTDLVGDVTNAAAGFSTDTNYRYFRERVEGNPSGSGGFDQFAWVVIFQTGVVASPYQYLGSMNGKDELVQLWQNTTPGGNIVFSPLLNDPAETKLWEGPAGTFARIVNAGGGFYYVDWALPKVVLPVGIVDATTKFFATSANENNYNKDHLNCYEALPATGTLVINKTTVGGNGTFGYTVSGTSASTPSITTVSNSGTTGNITVTPGTYAVSETVPTGWALTGNDCSGSFTIATGATKTCNFTNTKDATLTVTKVVTNDNGGTKVVSNFSLFVGSTSVTSGVANTFSLGSHVVSETPDSGYVGTISGDCDANGNVSLAAGDSKTCTITNDDVAPTLTFTKLVTNNYSGTLGATDFPLFINGNSVTSGIPNTLLANFLYTLTETQQTGYTGGYFSGDCNAVGSISLLPGENKTCTISNTDVQPLLTVTKIVINDNGGTKAVTDFPLFVGTTSVKSGVQNGFNAGNYTISETGISGYSSIISGDCATDGSITLAAGDVKTCTITNNDIAPTLTVNKVLSPVGHGAFDLMIDSTVYAFNVGNGGTTGAQTLSAGAHNVSEQAGNPSTIMGDYRVSYGGDCGAGGNVTLALDDDKTCTITNTAYGSLTIVKDTVPDNSQDFAYTVSGSGLTHFSLDDDVDPTLSNTKIFLHVVPGTYGVSETAVTGWDLTNTTCSDGSSVDEINIGDGENVTCTFTNTQRGSIAGAKLEDADGNTGTTGDQTGILNWVIELYKDCASDFTGCVLGTTINTAADGSYSFTNLIPGYYQVKEILQSGWTALSSLLHNVTVSPGESEINKNFVNFENVFISGQKFNDLNGDGAKDAGESGLSGWTINLDKDANGSVDGSTTTDGSGNYSFGDLKPGTYRVREVGQLGWTQITTNPSDITVSSGQNVTGIDFGNQMRGSITILKDAVPNAAQNFAFTSPQLVIPSLDDDSNPTLSNTIVFSDLGSNTYTISESTVSGWKLTDLFCTGDDNSSVDVNTRTATVTIDNPGENVTCTFTNTKYGSISGYKFNDINGNGIKETGDAYLDGWNIRLYNSSLSQIATKLTGAGSLALGKYNFGNLLPGTYYVCEDARADWVQTYPSTGTFNNDGYCHEIILTTGQNPANNNFGNFQKASIVVHKNVFGTDSSTDVTDNTSFTVYLDSVNVQPISETGDATYVDLLPGTYTVSEGTAPSGYSWVSTTDNGVVSVTSGGVHHVYIVNKQNSATLTVIKQVVNQNGGTATASTFTMNVTGVNVSNTSFPGSETGTTVTLDAGEYSADETANADFTKSFSGDCIGSISFGDEKTCTITNTQNTGTITVLKNVDWDESGQIGDHPNDVGGDTSWTWDIDGGEQDIPTGDSRTLNTDQYTITEDEQANYHLVSWVCDDDTSGNSSNIPVEVTTNGIACTITNAPDRGSIAGRKYNDANSNGTRGGSEPYLDGWTINLFDTPNLNAAPLATILTGAGALQDGQYKFTDLLPGTYNVCEVLKDGWAQTEPSSGPTTNNTYCRTITVDPGENVTGEHFGNVKLGIIQSRKYEDINNDSEHNDGENWLNGWTIRLYDGEWEQYGNDVVTGDGSLEDGQYRFENLLFGTYYICEVLQDGWAQTDPSGSEGYANGSGVTGEASRCRRFVVDQSGDESIGERHFGNAPLSNIHGYKWSDEDGDGEIGEGEDLLGDWTIFLDENDNEQLDEGEDRTTTEDNSQSDNFGRYSFFDLLPGNYSICEVQQEGWNLTYPSYCHNITLPNDSEEYNFGNEPLASSVEIEKSNDKSGGASAGNIVNYTLVITNTGKQTIFNLDIKDSLPGGFSYVLGTTTGDTTTDPIVAGSNLTWEDVTNLESEESITIHYQVKIADNVSNGTYKNFATCVGNVRGREEIVECNIDSSEVSIGSGQGYGGNLTGQVLGASIELPATGNPTWLLLFALGSLVGGLLLKKKYAQN